MRLFLIRHGKTFQAGEEPFFVGRGEDLPLTNAGEAQAAPVAEALIRAQVQAPIYYTSPLRRTRDFAAAIMRHRKEDRPAAADVLLDEIGYGSWSQKTHRAIRASGHGAQLAAWSEKSQWPTDADFSESPALLRARAKQFASRIFNEHAGQDVVVVGHNGQLRYFLSLIKGAEEAHFARGTFKLGCGHMGLLARANNEPDYTLCYWNYAPGGTFPSPENL